MSAYSQRRNPMEAGVAIRTNFAPGERPLYFNNKGLFSDPFLVSHLPDLEKKDSRDTGARFLNDYWNKPTYEGYTGYNHVYAQMLSLWDQYCDLLPDYNEAQLEERWIKPILKLLGWTYEVQDGKTKQSKRNIPDYSLFRDESDYIKAKKAKTDEAYFEHVLAVADAKAWKLALDGIGRSNNNPAYQIVRYMEHAGVQWGILTNGRFWRLYSTRSYSKHSTFYEIDLESLLAKRDDERFKYFYNFFRREAFEPGASSDQCFLDVVFENGVYYAKDVEENLKRRIFEVVEGICRGFIGEQTLSKDELRKVYEHSLYYLFRLMFILNCESKGLLAVDKTADYFEYSLRKLISNLKAQYDGNQNWSAQARTYGLINDLFDMLAKGDERIGVHGFGSEVFASGDRRFFEKNKIQDFHLNSALVQLACDYADDGDDLQFIDYKRLSEDHLGSLFEGLLEYELKYADGKLAVTKNGKIENWNDLTDKQKRDLEGSAIKKGQPYLASGSGERKVTGSYYTPSYIVDYIAKATIGPIVAGKSNSEILKLKFVDQAMGSAHFLLGVIRFLEYVILENANNGDATIEDPDSAGVRWMVLHNCIYGADINPLAVELSKFSMWIFSARRTQRLEPLSDQLFCIDSLLDEKVWKQFSKAGGFDAVVGNPPYIRVHKQDAATKQRLKERYLSVEGDFDAYVLFIENAKEQLRADGRAGFIVPNKFLSRDYAAPARKLLQENTVITEVIDLGAATDIFDASVYPAILVYENKKPSKKSQIRCANSGKSAEEFLSAKIKWSSVDQSSLDFAKWEFPVDDGATTVISKLGELKPLSERYTYDLFCGTPRAKDYYEWAKYLASGKPNGKSVLKYYVCKSIRPFELEWGTKISSLGEKLEKATFKIDDAGVSGQLAARFKKAPKILIRGNDYRLTSCFDGEGSAFVGVYGLIPKVATDTEVILAWTNSTVANYIFKRKNGTIGLSGGYFSVNAPHIDSLPTPMFSKEVASELAKIAKSDTDALSKIALLDGVIAKAFKISSEEMEAVYKSLGPKFDKLKEIYFAKGRQKRAS